MKVRMSGMEELSKWVRSLPRGMKIAGMRALAFWYGGRAGEGLRKEPPNKFVSRKSAYGKVSDAPEGYFSWKQFHYVAWKTKGFTQRYTRTHELSNAWRYKEGGQWDRVTFTNSAPGAEWAYNDGRQARQLNNVGWRGKMEMVEASFKGAMDFAQRKVNALIARIGITK